MADAPREPNAPSQKEDAARIAADEERLKKLEGDIQEARQTHESTKKSWQSGLLPEAEGDEGDAAAAPLQT
ncbi:hypothetical protein K6U06_02430 [Acidiferrimicrobium sp. IK]|uniref:hypothetical protein n=1 Tax=Acidiferrimicrobium sp. IK TaxID=2871700 RepID=UPI0021CB7F35|nr:hypothetical protein [Acidiferrimicrobium sp. IK]MCU4183202.1 hypothetical protein [Acidiferrimicrobium sp. IK]